MKGSLRAGGVTIARDRDQTQAGQEHVYAGGKKRQAE